MLTAELQEILETLLQRSERGEVKWLDAASAGMEESVEGEDFIVLMPNSSINVFRMSNGLVRVNLLNSQGNVSISITGNDVEKADLLEKLINSAKRSVFRIDETLEDIKRTLDNEGIIGDSKPAGSPYPKRN